MLVSKSLRFSLYYFYIIMVYYTDKAMYKPGLMMKLKITMDIGIFTKFPTKRRLVLYFILHKNIQKPSTTKKDFMHRYRPTL